MNIILGFPGLDGSKGQKGDPGFRGDRGDTPNCPQLDIPNEIRGLPGNYQSLTCSIKNKIQ